MHALYGYSITPLANMMELETQIDEIKQTLATLVRNLAAAGYEFEYPDEILVAPEADVEASIARIEQEIGTIPLAVKLFWRKIGSVNFCGTTPDWSGCDFPDPLVFYPASYAIEELNEFLEDSENAEALGYEYVIPIAPDYYHKADVSGGMWYNVSVPAAADDPPLNDEWHNITLMAYLKLSLANAGFAGLNNSTNHNWPIQELLSVEK